MAEAIVNFLAGSPLNRLSWLRPNHAFLNAVLASPSTRWILFNAGQPLMASKAETNSKKSSLAYLTTADVRPFLGSEPFFGQGQHNNGGIITFAENSHLESARHRGAPIVFLGLKETCEETASALPSSDFKDAQTAVANLEGIPFFALDVSEWEVIQAEEMLKGAGPNRTLAFVDARTAMAGLDAVTAAIFAEARSLVDWNQRNKFCAGCGAHTYSIWGGWKLSCSTLLPWADNTGRTPCPTRTGLHNFMHPRTDAVVIMIAIDKSGEKILLGRNKKFPGVFYSALAGFMEPGEAFEDAVKREMWEEAGVKVWDIKYHSAQPWPYPANLMVGFYATADSSAPIRMDLDNELEDARWFTREQVLDVIRHPLGQVLHPRGPITQSEETQVGQRKEGEPPFRIPPVAAIAGVLIKDWVEGRINNVNSGSSKKGNL